MKNSQQQWRKRVRLFEEQHGKCHWCSQHMALMMGHVKEPPLNQATFEHLDSKLSGERGMHPGEKRVVLACRRCNLGRAMMEQLLANKRRIEKQEAQALEVQKP